MARPRILTDESKVQAIINALRLGLSIKTAARIVGCTYQTIHNECNRSKAFFDRIKGAQGHCEQSLVACIYKAAHKGQWTAAAWMLERKWPQKWGKVERIAAKIEGDVSQAMRDFLAQAAKSTGGNLA